MGKWFLLAAAAGVLGVDVYFCLTADPPERLRATAVGGSLLLVAAAAAEWRGAKKGAGAAPDPAER